MVHISVQFSRVPFIERYGVLYGVVLDRPSVYILCIFMRIVSFDCKTVFIYENYGVFEFFTVIYMHYFSDITIEADKWHSILHYIGSLGHHCILL